MRAHCDGCGIRCGGVVAELRTYLEQKLLRVVVRTADSPAFLANRIGFQFINEALLCAERRADNGGVDYVDAILGPFTGRAMAPIATADFVGLDTHAAIVANLLENTRDWANASFALPGYVASLIGDGRLGRKSGGGLYRLVHEDGGRRRMEVWDVASGSYRGVLAYAFPFAEGMRACLSEGDYDGALRCLLGNSSAEAEICASFLLKYVVYSLYAAREVAGDVRAADDAMAMGFNWCPPLALLGALRRVTDVGRLIWERLPDVSEAVDVEALLAAAGPSAYDYRRFFRTGR